MRNLTPVTPQASTPSRSGGVGSAHPHESARLHVTGEARYVDDLPEPSNLLHLAVGLSTQAHARINHMDLTPVAASDGVVAVLTLADVPGKADIGPVFPGDPLLANEAVDYVGQPLFAVAARSLLAARRAVKRAIIEYTPLPAILSIEQAMAAQSFVRPAHQQQTGDATAAIARSAHQLTGEIYLRGQEHFYLEGQIACALPEENGGMTIYASSQHPGELQKLVAEVLALPFNQVQVEVRRMGGAFGGKETQAASLACLAALAAHKTGCPVKFRMVRQDDMVMTGKRHDFHNRYQVGFSEAGVIQGVIMDLAAKCGYSPDLSDAIVDRAMFHADNAYCLNAARITGHRCKTHTVSNTAFRGFGGPQGMMAAECMMDDIARHLGEDPLTIRLRNLYGVKHDTVIDADGRPSPRNQTHYGQTIEHNPLPHMMRHLAEQAAYTARQAAIRDFNQHHPYLRKGLALTPVKFGISFTVAHLNQAGALVHIYTDGSIHLNHGGTEMGQGLFTKVAQVVAEVFQVDLDRIQVPATRTDKVPNASPTAASSGADLNGMAALDACNTLKQRLIAFASAHYDTPEDQLHFADNHLVITRANEPQRIPFAELVQQAYLARVSLSATGFYKTPKIHYDRNTGRGRPFYYFAHGAALSEVIIDTLTGEHKVLRVDILHDAGQSLNPALDIGQIEGGFIQGMGWLTSEELLWDDTGKLTSNSPANYKIPTLGDLPEEFHVQLLENHPNEEATIYHSKAVGEPPFILAISVWCALRDAVASLADYRYSPPMNAPATPEEVLRAVRATHAWQSSGGDDTCAP